MSEPVSSHLLVGLKGSGKTSYLAALWHLLESAAATSSLRARHLGGEREYLNQIRESWLSFEEVGRTPMRVVHELLLPLEDASTGKTFDVLVPDLSGEVYRDQWIERRASSTFVKLARSSHGVILFIHPSSVRDAERIPPQEVQSQSPAVQRDGDTKSKEWDAESTPTQVQLVDLLQCVDLLRSAEMPSPIAVVVSAWDQIAKATRPTAWLERRLPLLAQFLSVRSEVVPVKVFGVSALGGDLQLDREKLLHFSSPLSRLRVVEDDSEAHGDLAAPLRFLIDAAEP